MESKRVFQVASFAAMAAFVMFAADAARATPGGGPKPDPITVKAAGGGDYTTIQAAIDAAASGDTINVYPGNYDETATNRFVLTPTQGPHQFGLFIDSAHSGITIQGVDADGKVIHDYDKVAAHVTTNATNNFGYSGIFVEGDRVTISGLDIGDNIPGANKTIEIIGDGFALLDSVLSETWGASVYLNDWRFDVANNTSHVKRYRIEGNNFTKSASIDIASGAGYSGKVKDRLIKKNTFANADFWPSISFNGNDSDVGWFVYSVGAATIKDNSFVNTFPGSYEGDEDPVYLETQGHIRARGNYDNSQFDWHSYWHQNKFNQAYVVGPKPPKDLRAYEYGVWGETVRRIGAIKSAEEAHAEAGDKVLSK